MNIVEFALKFKDLASSELGKFGNSARSTFNNASKYANDLTNKNKNLGKSYDELSGKIKGAKDELSNFNKQSSGGGMLSSIVKGNLISQGMMKAGSMAAGFFADSMSKSLERQQILTSFSVLAGSKGAGDSLAQDLIKYQKETILGPEVFKNAQTMMGFGFKSTEVMDNLKMLGDVSMGDADKLGSLTLAFSQIRAAGKLQGQDLLQLVNAGFNPLEQISKRTGKSIGELKDEMASGNISFSQVQQAFKDATSEGGKFNNMLSTIAQTPAGKMQALSGAWNEFKINAGSAFMPLISTVIDLASKLLPIIESVLSPLSKAVEKSVGFVKEYKEIFLIALGPITAYMVVVKTVTLITKIWTGAQWLLNIAMNANPIGLIILAISALVALVVVIVKKYNDWGAAFTLVIGPLGIMINMFMAFKNNWDSIVNAFKTDGIIGGLKRIGVVLLDTLLYPMQQLLELVAKIPGLGYLAAGGAKRIADVRSRLNLVTPVKTAADKTLTDTTNTDLLAQTANNTAANAEASKSTEKSLSSGGQKVVNITIGKFLDDININTNTLSEGVSDIEGKILEMFARVVSQGVPAI